MAKERKPLESDQAMQRKTRKNSSHEELTELADAAFLQAAYKVVERAKQTGTKVIVWKNGKLTELDPSEIRLPKTKKDRLAAED